MFGFLSRLLVGGFCWLLVMPTAAFAQGAVAITPTLPGVRVFAVSAPTLTLPAAAPASLLPVSPSGVASPTTRLPDVAATTRALAVCIESLALVRRLGVLAYAGQPHPAVERLVLAAALAERTARSGEFPALRALTRAADDVPGAVARMDGVREAVAGANGACQAPKPEPD